MREKVGKSRNTAFFQWFGAPEGRKVGSLKRRVRSQLARWEMKNCTPLWREGHFEVKMYKTHHSRTTFGSWDVEKVHAVVARSTFRSENVQSTTCSRYFWRFRCRKSARRCGAKHISKSKCTKTHHVRTTFRGSDVPSRGRRKGLCTLSKVSKTWGFCGISKNDGRRGTFEEDLQRCISRGRRSTKDMFIRDVRRSGRWFPETRYILEHQIFRCAETILRDRCSTSYDLASLFRGRLEKSQNALIRGCQLCTQLFIFEGSLAELFRFWCCQVQKLKSLAELLCFWCCPVQKMKKSRRISWFLMLSTSKNEEVSQNCFVFDVVNFEKWGSHAELRLSTLKNEEVSQNS